ncbi:putative small auxin-up RNA [Helianthus annuus]|uniref:Small auxin-up RNA n=1 Tax=Helianthus annuus TaxID=4232 RepID=A0A251VPG2_HELAN|nr:auxin-responsive protein SAUR50 [Helianthus annuus]KAF5822749.1 putative small auxin-up RNA [Helianthus annuus]KAJ0623569.1 putative small auxin-up RNA [Helianthus annuus]KAJ0627547.1 putative small auxin-up RNA [Helianthus annuus]KAJ0629995.1 putative small auxin-up RNA [Helianthus annuus]KAJ0948764.1 putative small auxin-up RNA [Helianthus annuus]
MTKVRNSGNGKKNNGILRLRLVLERLQKGLFLAKKRRESYSSQEMVPKDVKEGHFAVIASDDYVKRRFVIPITYLRHPSFLRLLERAAEEYGFDHEGALMIPCRPSELEWMLEEQIGSQDGADWTSCKTMVESC